MNALCVHVLYVGRGGALPADVTCIQQLACSTNHYKYKAGPLKTYNRNLMYCVVASMYIHNSTSAHASSWGK